MRKDRYTLFFILFILFSIYCFVFGESGILERMQLQKEKKDLILRINGLTEENKRLQLLYRRYKNGEFYRDEAVKSGYIDKGERLLFFRGEEENNQIKIKQDTQVDKKDVVDLKHLRVLWIVVSMMIILFYFIRKIRNKEE